MLDKVTASDLSTRIAKKAVDEFLRFFTQKMPLREAERLYDESEIWLASLEQPEKTHFQEHNVFKGLS